MQRSFPALVAAAMAAGCSSEEPTPNNLALVVPSSPVGFLAGVVQDAVSDQPIEGTRVDVFGGGVAAEALTGADGRFSVGPVAAGAALLVSLSRDGYTPLQRTATIPSSSGDFPTDNGAVLLQAKLVPATGILDVDVADSAGRPVPAAVVQVSVTGEAGVYSATTDGSGRASLSALPDVWRVAPRAWVELWVTVSPPTPEYGTWSQALRPSDLAAGVRRLTAVLPRSDPPTPLSLLATNAADSGLTIVDAEEGLVFLFDRPVSVNAFSAELFDDAAQRVGVELSLGELPGRVAARPSEARPGLGYFLRLRSLDGAWRWERPFFLADPGDQPVAVSGRWVDGTGQGQWGSRADRLILETNLPMGRKDSPGFRARVWLELDLDGSGRVGDGPGERPGSGAPDAYPPGLPLDGEAVVPSGFVPSGFGRTMAGPGPSVAEPLTDPASRVGFEVRFPTSENGGEALRTPPGRPVPAALTGVLSLSR